MTLDAGETSSAPRLLAWPSRAPWWLTLPLALVLAALLSVVGYFAADNYPKPAPPQPSDLGRAAAAVFGVPAATADGTVAGDLLIERFYALEVETGERYVGDVLKGRIQDLQPARPDGGGPYTLVLDLKDLQRDRALYSAFVDQVARPEGNYLGLRVLPGIQDAFRINYNGFIPSHRTPFRGPNGEDAYDYLLQQSFARVTAEPHVVGVDGTNFLLSSSDRFTFFRIEFRTGKTLFLSELLIVDTTAREQRVAMFNLREQYKRR